MLGFGLRPASVFDHANFVVDLGLAFRFEIEATNLAMRSGQGENVAERVYGACGSGTCPSGVVL